MLQKSDIDMFPSSQDFVENTSIDIKVLPVFVIMGQHLKGLAINFCLNFSENKIFKREIFGLYIPLQRYKVVQS